MVEVDFVGTVAETDREFVDGRTTEKPMIPTEDCLILQWHSSSNSDVISLDALTAINRITTSYLFPLLFLFGAVGNILSMAVFCKLGLRERINLCLFALAAVDFIVVSYAFALHSESFYMRFTARNRRRTYGVVYTFLVKYCTGLIGFGRLSQFLSAVVAVERCACVASPFRARKLVRTSTMAAVIAVAALVLVGGMFGVIGQKYTVVCIYDPLTNITRDALYVTKFYLKHKDILDTVDVFVMSTAFPAIFLGLVIFTSVFTTTKLWSSLAWRATSVMSQNPAKVLAATAAAAVSPKEVALTKMLISTSVLFIVCSAPNLAVQLASFFASDLKEGGRYDNLVQVLHLVRLLSTDIQCSLSFVVYYKTGSRYRSTVRQLLKCHADSQEFKYNNSSGKMTSG
ncbi:uncharacterized protein LOC112564457 isoform X1 [Pomacea canaliculata]|uniref:uncharacterized protein LOC112564457 isoform X1 n=2 Tax=Pomacea canaliculata TaxID=400727 RepID=UPI000D72AD1C|nr:uncharacterized protein LOC112564457 isoform X1 [Pomacea canaliculata]XP_025095084.1 uncharacterized protein LOC112564457 isoform X1 [Pomacea canaliculata]